MVDTRSIEAFLEVVQRHQGVPPLSQAKLDRLADRQAVTVITEGDTIVAVGVAAAHPQRDGSNHWAVETAVTPSLQFRDFERSVLTASLETVPSGAAASVWSSRPSLASALEDMGFHRTRTLAHLVVALPIAGMPSSGEEHAGAVLRPFTGTDRNDLIRINNEAFADHREAGSMTGADFDRISHERWFDPGGIVVAERRRGEGLVGFCWTKVHPSGDGEIFRIAVEPSLQGSGLGRSLLIAGFDALAAVPAVRRGALWVDEANGPAMALYRSMGMVIERQNSEYERPA